jgi:hypothetical protein
MEFVLAFRQPPNVYDIYADPVKKGTHCLAAL